MAEDTPNLDRLVELLERLSTAPSALTPAPVAGPDAMDVIAAAPPRETQVAPLRDDAVVQNFRTALLDGLIEADTVNQFLRLIAVVLERLPV